MDIKRKIVLPALVGAAYAALTMLLAPISYGPLQFRLSEALCALPFFLPHTALGLFLGCALANTISAAGPLDIICGSAATLAAGLCTAGIGRPWRMRMEEPGPDGDAWREKSVFPSLWTRVWACLMPVLWNGAVVGAVLAYTSAPDSFWEGFLLIGMQVALGEAAVMLVLGLPLMGLFLKLPALAKLYRNL